MNKKFKLLLFVVFTSFVSAEEVLVDVFLGLKLGAAPAEVRKARPEIKAGSFLHMEEERPDLDKVIEASANGQTKELDLMEKIGKVAIMIFYFKDDKLDSLLMSFRPFPADAVPVALVSAYGGLAVAAGYSDRDSIIVEWKTEEGYIWYTFPEDLDNPNEGLQKFTAAARDSMLEMKKLKALSDVQKKILEAHFKQPQR